MSAPDRPSEGHARDPDALIAELEQLVVTDPSLALSTARANLDAIDASDNIAHQLRIRRMLIMAYSHTSQFDHALEISNTAINLPGARDAPVDLARVRLASMQPLATIGHIDDAIAAGEAALEMLLQTGDRSLAGRAALNTGSIHAMTGRPDAALPFFDQARDYLAGEPPLLGQIETNRGTALAALDRFEEAEAAFAHAASLLDTEEMSWAAALAEGNLADLAARQGAINRGLRHFEAARRYLEHDDALGQLGRINAEEAAMLSNLGLANLASDRFVDAIDLLRQHGAPADLATAQLAYGEALVDVGELDRAAELIGPVSTLFNPEEFPDLDHQLTQLSAQLAISNGAWDLAAALVGKGLAAAADRPIQRLRWTALHARLHLASGKPQEARVLLEDALEEVERAQITPLVAELHESLMDIARHEGNEDLANEHARKVIEATERVRGTIQADRLRQSWQRRRLGVYADLYRSLIAQPSADAQHEAFGIAERIRSRMLFDAMHTRGHDVESTGPVSDAERPLVETLESHRRWLNWMYSSLAAGQEPTDAQIAELHEHEDAAQRLTDRLATLRPQPGFETPIDLDTLQDRMPAEDMVLSYLMADDTLTVQVITSHEVYGIADLALAETVSKLVAALQFQLGRALAHGDREISPARVARLERDTNVLLTRLYDLLIAPVERSFDGKTRVIIVPSGDLHSVPFNALLHDGVALMDRITTTRAPGISILVRMFTSRTRPDPTIEHPLVAGVPDEAAPGLEDEARYVATRLPNTELLLGEEASIEAVLSRMPDADLVHLACHGHFHADHPTASGLRLADGWLTLDRLTDLRLNHPLVVLTGCETGRVRVEQGDDLTGIVAAMIAAGADGVVMSLWKTHDRAAQALMTAFYDAIVAGTDYLSALKIAIRHVREEFPHPAFWAPFVAVYV